MRIYTLVRTDLGMTCGKMCSQSSHAALGTYLQCKDLTSIAAYHCDFPASPGTKVCLQVSNLDQLLRAEHLAQEAGLSFYRVVDSGCSNFYNGEPTITALGIGPATKSQIQHITRRFKLM